MGTESLFFRRGKGTGSGIWYWLLLCGHRTHHLRTVLPEEVQRRELFVNCARARLWRVPGRHAESGVVSRFEPLNVPQKKTPHPGPLPLGRGEGESWTVHLRREVHGENSPSKHAHCAPEPYTGRARLSQRAASLRHPQPGALDTYT